MNNTHRTNRNKKKIENKLNAWRAVDDGKHYACVSINKPNAIVDGFPLSMLAKFCVKIVRKIDIRFWPKLLHFQCSEYHVQLKLLTTL
jgi:hypothetical protein